MMKKEMSQDVWTVFVDIVKPFVCIGIMVLLNLLAIVFIKSEYTGYALASGICIVFVIDVTAMFLWIAYWEVKSSEPGYFGYMPDDG